jgi:hypothetical protein
MNHVTDLQEAGRDASVLRDAGSGGLIGRAVLSEAPLVDHLAEDETARYVLRNKKHGVTVEGPDGTEEVTPDRGHSGVAVITDTRVLFAVGHSGGDRTLSVSLPDVVDVRTEDGLIGGAFVVETVDDERYRFPCRGDLEHVREYLDAAVGVWTRAERQVEQASEKVERLRSAFEAGNTDVVLAAVGDVEETLSDAREAADALEGARRTIETEARAVREELAAIERRAHAESAEQARERAHVRWDDQDYEAAFDDLDEADEAYAAALAVDADEPDDDLLEGRRETLADERARLAGAPVERAAHAADVAAAAEDPGAAVEWWGTAVDRYETALSLDWGRDDRRFGGDPEQLREELADAARELVSAYCTLARKHLAEAEANGEQTPDATGVADELAAEALAEARGVATERVPDALEEVEAVEATLDDHREDLSDAGEQVGAEVDGGHATTSGSEPAGPTDENEPAPPDSLGVDAPEVPETSNAQAPEVPDAPGEAVSEPDPKSGPEGDAEPELDGDAAETGASESSPGISESQTIIGDPTTDRSEDDDAVVEGTAETEPSDVEPAGGTGIGEGGSVEEGDGEDLDVDEVDTGREFVTDPTAVSPANLPSLVARVFESSGWSTAVFGASTARQYDLLAGTDGPISVTVCVWTVHPEAVEQVDVPAVERFVAYFRRAEEADVGAICTAAPMSEAARSRAAEEGLEVLDADDLAERLADLSVPAEEF